MIPRNDEKDEPLLSQIDEIELALILKLPVLHAEKDGNVQLLNLFRGGDRHQASARLKMAKFKGQKEKGDNY